MLKTRDHGSQLGKRSLISRSAQGLCCIRKLRLFSLFNHWSWSASARNLEPLHWLRHRQRDSRGSRRHFKRSFVAVLLYSLDPAGSADGCASLVDLLLHRWILRRSRLEWSANQRLGGRSFQARHRGGKAAMELVIVIGIQQVVFPVVLVVEHHLNASRGCAQAPHGLGFPAPL